jgi:hypothetical protein
VGASRTSVVVGLRADSATNAAATARDRRVHGHAGDARALSGAIEGARSGRRRYARRRGWGLDAAAATRVRMRGPIRANAGIGGRDDHAAIGWVETDFRRPTSRVPASEFACVGCGIATGGIAGSGIRAAFARRRRAGGCPTAARNGEAPRDGEPGKAKHEHVTPYGPTSHEGQATVGCSPVKERRALAGDRLAAPLNATDAGSTWPRAPPW